MIRCQRTIKDYRDGYTALWVTGSSKELLDLRRETVAKYGFDVRFGDLIQIRSIGPIDERFRLTFLFEHASDAMLFKLSN